ncbi:hypothetical protein DOTSEDRAFT_49782 [Dothistroma septosporum NZE10]|uniref:HMG box domain-containing protein n=1 Tax=Dothistroma septosporum (strain NZE10 / CBS 128990) TaxID=675120 RepID=N1Q474_DOTSN|nr:hypothetical protein DOTSEDRAFT_49782 [Dothistroma septosporum NZE10]
MDSTTIVTQGPSPEQDYGLDAVARHNAQTSTQQFPAYHEDARGLGIYRDDYGSVYQDDQYYIHNPPTPRSNTASEGVRPRSGRSTRGRTDSPFSTSKSRVSKSPAPKSRREKKSKLDRSKTPKLTAPLSVLTKDSTVPVKDIEAYVNRSSEERLQKLDGKKIPRPMNSFMLYRSCYADRLKEWSAQNNHQVVSAVAGESWPMESDEVRQQFDDWSKLERANHQLAFPAYKFSPSKAASKKRKGEFSDDEGDSLDLDNDPDGEYRSGRSVRQRRQEHREHTYLPNTVGFESHPYYGQQLSGYEQSRYQYANPGRPLPSNIAYDGNGMPYNPQIGAYLQSSLQQQQQYQYMQEVQGARAPTPASINGQQSLGGFGLPGGQADDIFSTSRASTPLQHYQQSYDPAAYPQYQQHYQTCAFQQVSMAPSPPQPGTQLYEHQQYLQQASQPQTAIDPSLEAAMEAAAASSAHGVSLENHFDDAIGDMTAGGVSGLTEYFEQSNSPADVNATLAPTWSPDLKI